MTVKFNQTEDKEKEIYFFIGLLSTKFARMEANVIKILDKLIVDDFVISNTIMEGNSLAKNIELLKKLNKYRGIEEGLILNLCSRISSVRKDRNLFIHGLWGEPYIEENDIMVVCSDPRIEFFESGDHKQWRSTRPKKFRVGYLKKQVDAIEEILLSQDSLLIRLENQSL